ncbi:hypothetical protein M0813_17205 [Anaeramoeba flamelloides]|uniref:Uncharacterized protein n=1 Tax=Anaeramoeba flamelloides TaxID=1746091 RepID=A0AAV8AE04_9EUKA|nr:hypothetical protein M0812_07239 [Anaeramoeba flamelloides]KAJ6249321.1 hypothetical protein M0813_17205 [Anaeramoeba flamelloides]
MTTIKKGGAQIRVYGFVTGILCMVFGLIDLLRDGHNGVGIYTMLVGVLVFLIELPVAPVANKLEFLFGDNRVRGIIYILLSIFCFWGHFCVGAGISILLLAIWYLILGFM